MVGVNERLVEICYNSTWGLVCDDQWGANDNNVQVVCKQFCFESGEKGKICPNVRDGIFWLDEVNCTGDEGRLDNCAHNNIGEHDCTLAEAVTVICSTNVCLEGTRCTQDGNFACECNNSYTKDETGYKDIDECTMNVPNCTKHSMWKNIQGSFYCMCKPGYSCGEDGYCTDIDECAMNTTHNCTNGTSECSYECAMDTQNCTRNCSKCVNTPGSYFCMCCLGYTGNDCEDMDECENPTLNNCDVNAMCINTCGSFSCMCNDGYFGSGTHCELCNPEKPFCLGYTKNCTDIDECALGLDDCDENAICTNTEGCYICTCREGYCGDGRNCTVSDASTGIRLVHGNETSGLVEVLHNCEWRSVCDDYWTDEDAKVACRQLGLLPYAAGSYRRGIFRDGEEVQYWLDDVQCKGDELSLFDCPHKDTHNCGRRERAGVHCLDNDDVGIRLVKTTTLYSGIIELRIRNEWRSVCHDKWTDEDAQVACRSLELPSSGAKKEINGKFEPGEKVIYWI
ncbi:Fibrillin-1, partial [Geodia barretti]